jgi:hypothetical protein
MILSILASACDDLATQPARTVSAVGAVSLLVDGEQSGTTPYSTTLAATVDSIVRSYPNAPQGYSTVSAIGFAMDTGGMRAYLYSQDDGTLPGGNTGSGGGGGWGSGAGTTQDYSAPVVGGFAPQRVEDSRGVTTLYGDVTYQMTTGGYAQQPPFTCTDISIALYDAGRRARSAERRAEWAGGIAALAALKQLADAIVTGAVNGTAATALGLEAMLAMGTMSVIVAGEVVEDYLAAELTRQGIAAMFRRHNCF